MDDFGDGDFDHDVGYIGSAPNPRINDDIPTPERAAKRSASDWERTRRDWSLASLAALGYCALLVATLLALNGVWDSTPRVFHGIVLALFLGGAYAVALLPKFSANAAISNLFYTLGVLVLFLALALCSPLAPLRFVSDDFWVALADSAASVSGRWALGAFLLATLLNSQTLQIIATLAIIVWMGSSSSMFDPHGALLACIVGEYWAWGHSSRVAATVYAALCCWTLVSEPSLWRQPSTIAPMVVALSMLAFWYGASYKSAMCRGCALGAGGLALCAAATPVYWARTLGAKFIEAHGDAVPYALSAFAALFFVLFCAHMIFRGANRSAPRFGLGVFLAATWTIVMAVMATRKFGVGCAALVLCGAAFCFFLLLAAEKRLANSPAIKRYAGERKRVTTDAAEDDPEFNDPVDSETVERRETPAGGVETAWLVVGDWLWSCVRTPGLYAVLALHFLLVFMTAL